MSELFSLQGRLYADRPPTAAPTTARHGSATCRKPPRAGDGGTSDKFESFSGNRLLYGSLQKSKAVNFTMRRMIPAVLDRIGPLWHDHRDCDRQRRRRGAASGAGCGPTVTTAKKFISAVTMESAAAVALVEGTNYEITNATIGLITILDPGVLTQPFTVSYTNEDASAIVMFATPQPPQRYVIFSGINTVNGDNVEIDLPHAVQPGDGLRPHQRGLGRLPAHRQSAV